MLWLIKLRIFILRFVLYLVSIGCLFVWVTGVYDCVVI